MINRSDFVLDFSSVANVFVGPVTSSSSASTLV